MSEPNDSADPNTHYAATIYQTHRLHGLCCLCGLRIGEEYAAVVVITNAVSQQTLERENYCRPCFAVVQVCAHEKWDQWIPYPDTKKTTFVMPSYLVKDGHAVRLFRPSDPAAVAYIRELNIVMRETNKNEDDPS